MSRNWVPLAEAVKTASAATWVEWFEVERQNGFRCLRCLKRFAIPHLIPVNCQACWDGLSREEQKDSPVGIYVTIDPDKECL